MSSARTWFLFGAVAAPLLLSLACDDDETGPDADAQVVAVLNAQYGMVTLTDGGSGVSGATVELNGMAATPGPFAGSYDLALPAPVPAGGTLTLDVSNGEFVIQGTGTVPEAPGAVAVPATLLATDPIEVTWTSTSDPTGFEVVAEDGSTSEVFPVAGGGAARAHAIPAGTLANGDWTISVAAINLGGFTGDAEAGSEMRVRAFAGGQEITIGPALLLINGAMSPVGNHVILRLRPGEAVVDGASVRVNGEAAIQSGPGTGYYVDLTTPVAGGGQLDLDITVDTDVVQGLGNVPEAPVITAPANSASFAAADPIEVTWTSTSDPDRFVILVDGAGPGVAGNLRSFTFSGGSFTPGTYTIGVVAFQDGVFTGPAHPDSQMRIRNEGTGVQITVTP